MAKGGGRVKVNLPRTRRIITKFFSKKEERDRGHKSSRVGAKKD